MPGVSSLRTMPLLLHVGLGVLLGGALADLVYHALPATTAEQIAIFGASAHLVTFAGMVLMSIGLVQRELAHTMKGWRSRLCHSELSSTRFRRPSS